MIYLGLCYHANTSIINETLKYMDNANKNNTSDGVS